MYIAQRYIITLIIHAQTYMCMYILPAQICNNIIIESLFSNATVYCTIQCRIYNCLIEAV